MKFLVLLLCFVISETHVNGANILGIFHVPTKSHHIIGSTLLKSLAAKGHQVTMLSPFPLKESIPNYKDLYIDGVLNIGEELRNSFFSMSLQSQLNMMPKFLNFSTALSAATLQSPSVQYLLNSNETFDVIIIDSFGNEAFFGFGHHFKAHVIAFATGNSFFVNHLTGNVAPYGFVPNGFTTYTDKMTFFDRLSNTIMSTILNILRCILNSYQEEQFRRYFKNAPDMSDIVKNVSLVLVNSHVVFETPRPYLPNMIPVGGMHIDEPKKMRDDLQTFLDEANEGVIYFSLGSNLRSTELPEDKRNAILQTFAKLPYKVIWKFEHNRLLDKPLNLKTGRWFPQTDILAHPNVKLFITHGGLLSSTEGIYRGVPMLGIPIYGDQMANTANFVSAGCGLGLSLEELTEETFTAAIQEILNNPKYQKNVKVKSEIVKDQPMKPLDTAIFWVEHVIWHGGGHLRSAAADVSLVQYLLLDVLAFITAVAVSFVFGLYCIVKITCGFCKRNKQGKQKQNKKKPKLA